MRRISTKKNDRPLEIPQIQYEFCVMDEIVTYVHHKKLVHRTDGTLAKYAIGTTIWTMVFSDKEGNRTLFAFAKNGSQSRVQFEKILEMLPKVKKIYSDSAIWYRNAEIYLLEMLRKNGVKYRKALDLIPEWICGKGCETNIIEGLNNALRNGVSSIKRRTSGCSKTLERLQILLNLACHKINSTN